MNPINMLLQMVLRQNPALANNPRAQDYISVIQNGDSKRGEEIARNLCASYGVTPEEAVNQAKGFFGNILGRGR